MKIIYSNEEYWVWLSRCKRIIDLCEQNRASILTKEDKKYIDNAKKQLDAPVVLYYKDNLNFASELERRAIVGARRCTRDARENCMC